MDKSFPLGELRISPGVQRNVGPYRAGQCLGLHARGQWGGIDEDARRRNDMAVASGGRIVSVYPIDPARPLTADNELWIITEADRQLTKLLLAGEF
jgi:hypothetical protein